MRSWNSPIKLEDCERHGIDSGAELFLVEGDSAAKSARQVRDPQKQAILPMQGKPLNALKSSRINVLKNPLYSALVDSIGTGWESECIVSQSRYSKIVFLFDPDADGIHCGMLALWFFYRWLRPLLDAEMVFIAQAPILEIQVDGEGSPRYIHDEEEHTRVLRELDERKWPHIKKRYRGLASIGAETLARCCMQPETRNLRLLRARDAEIAIELIQNMRLGK